jgi:hypothetical protein
LAGIFAMWASIAVIYATEREARRRWPWSLLAGLCLLLSLLSKEAYLGLPLALWALLVTRGRSQFWPAVVVPAGLLLLDLGYLVVRFFYIDSAAGGAGISSALDVPRFWTNYVIASFFPFDLSIERLHGLDDYRGLSITLLILCFVATLAAIWARSPRSTAVLAPSLGDRDRPYGRL